MSRFIIGIDPGITGGIAVLDPHGRLVGLIDMPVEKKSDNKNHVDAVRIFHYLENIRRRSNGTQSLVRIEKVNAMPGKASKANQRLGMTRQSMGATSAFNFGEGYGLVKGVCYSLGFEVQEILPAAWKRSAGLQGTPKDQSRLLANRLHPGAELGLKKHHGRADAILLTTFG